ncbi:MAG: ribosomal RNA small subunit methyltransferase A [Candidatus Omnitrophica bacterium]|nr:ribosomal RNA small subunit methyltransferase A [Candidatus Omnitrophota bacterium]
MKQYRSLGQVFLEDKQYIDSICSCLNIKNKAVLEIGPGAGVMSSFLSKNAKKLYCVELDKRFFKFLKDKFKENPKVIIINQDICKYRLDENNENLVVFGNVPYQISKNIVNYLVKYRNNIDDVYIMFQEEFVNKLTAKHKSKEYNFLSCFIQYYAKLEKLFDIPAKAFSPLPKVDSSFIKMKFYKNKPYTVGNEELLFDIIQKAFSQRRKKLINSLKGMCNVKLLDKLFESLNIDISVRPADVSLEKYCFISKYFEEQ